MRHGKKFNHLGRTSAHRKAMLSNMASSLIIHKRINTTVAKAKALKKYVEPLITKSKNDSTHSRRVVFSYLQNKEAVSELFREISQKIADRPGGYTRILKTGNRLGDNAEMCMVELVDYNEILLAEKDDKKVKTTRRRRRSSGKKKTSEEAQKAVVDTTTEVIEEVAETQQEVKVEEEIKEPKAEKPKAEEPKAEVPKAEEPKAEEPKAEKPKSEEPKSEEKDEEEKQ